MKYFYIKIAFDYNKTMKLFFVIKIYIFKPSEVFLITNLF